MFANHRARWAVGIFLGLLLLSAGRAEDKPAKTKGELDKLQGEWVMGKQVFIISGDEMRAYHAPRAASSRIKIKIDPSKEPKQIDFDEGRVGMSIGIYEVKGDTFTSYGSLVFAGILGIRSRPSHTSQAASPRVRGGVAAPPSMATIGRGSGRCGRGR